MDFLPGSGQSQGQREAKRREQIESFEMPSLPAKQEGGAPYQHKPDKQTGSSTVMKTDE